MDRRGFLRAFGAAACSAAAHPLLSTVTLAQGAPVLGENRLVVVILRGAMDGLDVVQPRFDAEYALLRPGLVSAPALALGPGDWQMHAALEGLLPLWQAGELAFVHATSTPYRDKRSHFDGQDMLEAGTGADLAPGAVRDGWLNRMLQAVPGVQAETAYAVGRDELKILTGAAEVRNWAPDQELALSAQGRLLMEHVAHDDGLFRDAVAEALALTEGGMAGGMMAAEEAGGVTQLVDFVAGHLRGATRIAAFSLTGWDTHKGQANALRRPLARLQEVVLRMKAQLGAEVWGRTALLAMTEFGRTARENGSSGTDHGTGGLMLAAGGAVKGGQVLGPWPGLSEGALYQGRDLMPTSDVRAWAAHAMAALYGLDRGVLEGAVFPGLRAEGAAGLIL
jgi:uncharacterized protein (DUF1501 family)